MSKIKAVIFDMGGVLVDLDMEVCKRYYKENLEYYKIDEILDPFHQMGIYGDMEAGLITADEFRNSVISESKPGTTKADVDKAVHQLLVGIDDYKADLLKELSKDYDLYILSNNNAISIVRCAEILEEAGVPLNTTFKRSFLSHEMKMLKPSPEIYHKVIKEIGLDPSEMLFIDDSMLNVQASIDAGLPAIYYEPGSDLRALLEAHL